MTRDEWFAICAAANINPGFGIVLWYLVNDLGLITNDEESDQ